MTVTVSSSTAQRRLTANHDFSRASSIQLADAREQESTAKTFMNTLSAPVTL